MKLLTKESCPHCKKDFDSQHELENLEPAFAKGKIQEIESNAPQQLQQEIKEVIKEVEKTVSPDDSPYFECSNGDCGEKMHRNPNYKRRPKEKCKNCDSLNGSKNCKNCGNQDGEEFETLEKEELDELKIPEPKEVEHTHGHD